MRTSIFLFATLLLTACNGGGGGGGGSRDAGFGSVGFQASLSLGSSPVCAGYTLNSSNCSGIGGTWNTSTLTSGVCTNSDPALVLTGKCEIEDIIFTKISGANDTNALTKCRDLNGEMLAQNSIDCASANGNWSVNSTVVGSCSKAPADLAECNVVGGTWGLARSISGNFGPSFEGVDAGEVLIFTDRDETNTDFIQNGTRIHSVSGNIKIIGGPMGSDDLWTAPAPVSRASDFFLRENGMYAFKANFGKGLDPEDSYNGILLELNLIYQR